MSNTCLPDNITDLWLDANMSDMSKIQDYAESTYLPKDDPHVVFFGLPKEYAYSMDCVKWDMDEMHSEHFDKNIDSHPYKYLHRFVKDYFKNTIKNVNCVKDLTEYIKTIIMSISGMFEKQCEYHKFNSLSFFIGSHGSQWHNDAAFLGESLVLHIVVSASLPLLTV